MIKIRGLRCHGAAIRGGAARSTARSPCLPFHPHLSTSLLRINVSSRPLTRLPFQGSVGQVRSISLWGWGSVTRKEPGFGQLHSSTHDPAPDSVLGHDGAILAQQQMDQPKEPILALHQAPGIPSLSALQSDDTSSATSTTSSATDLGINTIHPPADIDNPETAENIFNAPERIGYLKEVCGLDFGWGPSTIMEWVLELIHIYGGYSWASSIVLLALSVRVVMFIPLMQSSDAAAKMRAAKPLLDPARSKMQKAQMAGDMRSLAEAKAEAQAIRDVYDIKFQKIVAPILIQIPAGFGIFRVLRNMAERPVPALEVESWLWAPNLVSGDPYLILPVANAIATHFTMKLGSQAQQSTIPSSLRETLAIILPCLSCLIILFQASCIQIYFCTTSILALAQNYLLKSPSFRQFLGLYPYDPPDSGPPPPPSTREQAKLENGENPVASSSSAKQNQKVDMSTTSRPESDPSPRTGPAGLKLYLPPTPNRPSSSSSSSSSASTTTATTATTTTTPPPTPTPTLTTTSSPTKSQGHRRSVIDRFVDAAKARKDSTVRDLRSVFDSTLGRRSEGKDEREAKKGGRGRG